MEMTTALLDLAPSYAPPVLEAPRNGHAGPSHAERLRRIAWEVGEHRPADGYLPEANHVGLAMVHPTHGFAHWRIRHDWVEQVARSRGGAWDGSRPVLRLYDVSFLEFTGLNAHRIQDEHLPELCGQRFFNLPKPGTWQIAEVGFLLRNGELIPAARSVSVPFAADAASRNGGHGGLLVVGPGRVEQVGNVWEQEREMAERRRPRLRGPLRIASFAFASRAVGHEGAPATFVSELASGQAARGHEAHVFLPADERLPEDRQVGGAFYHALPGVRGDTPLGLARSFAEAARRRLAEMGTFDLFHLHEWMAGGAAPARPGAAVVQSFSSLETTRRNGTPPDHLSQAVEEVERALARSARCLLVPAWLRDRAVAELGVGPDRAHAFAMEGRLPNEWEGPLELGQVKRGAGFGPLDRMVLYVGPLEHAAGVDLLVEAMPTLLGRWGNVRLAYVGMGPMAGHLERRANEVGAGHAVRLLGHAGGDWLTQLLRACEGLVLPSRYRQPQDDLVVDLARKAGRPVVTTHGGPAHLVRHEQDGLVTYDNPGSMVWALDRLLGDAGHAARMGANGRRRQDESLKWDEVAGHYLEACVQWFPELSRTQL